MVSYRPSVPLPNIALIFLLTTGTIVCEVLLFYQEIQYTIASYTVLLAVLSLAPIRLETETPIFQAFALIPVFRLVNFAMPVFEESAIVWFVLVYGPFIPVLLYFGWYSFSSEPVSTQSTMQAETVRKDGGTTRLGGVTQELPWWIGGKRGGKFRGLVRTGRQFFRPPDNMSTGETVLHWGTRFGVAVLLPVVLVAILTGIYLGSVYLAEVEYSLTEPSPVVSGFDISQAVQLAVVMIVFVGFVEELLFRGILQKILERRLGIVLGLLLTSAIYGSMYSIHGDATVMLFGGGVGLLLGILYDLTDSLVLVSVVQGLGNMYLYGIIPLRGTTTSDLLQTITDQVQQYAFVWLSDLQSVVDIVFI